MPPFVMKTPKGKETRKISPGSEIGPNWRSWCI